MNKLLKIDKVDISLKQLSDINTQNNSYDRVDNIRNGQILTAYVNSERVDQFRFRYLTDILVAGSGITFSTVNGITTISSSGGGPGSSPLTTKGDIYTYGTADTRLPVGTNGQILYADSTTATGLKWDTAPTGGGGLLSGTATQSPAGVYTTTITGPTAYNAGDAYMIKFDSVNDGASTLNINSIGAVNLYKNTNFPIAAGDIKANQEIMVVYDGTNFQCIGLISDQLLAYVHNAEGAVINKGQAVYAYQASGNKMSVKLARADTDGTSAKTIGLVYDSSIGIGGNGYIIIQGVIEGINTAAFTAGDTLYLSGATFGAVTATKQYAPIHLVYVGIVERANAGNGQIYVRCQNGYELDELHDVQAQTPADNDTLYYDLSATQWKTKSIPNLSGPSTIGATIDGSGGTITVGQKGYVQIPYACTITAWRLIANAAGSIIIDIYKNPAPTIPVTLVTTTGKPTLSGVQTNTSTSLGGWTTTAVAANDMIGFTVVSATTVSWVILQIFVTKI